jgi:hypothetical protein
MKYKKGDIVVVLEDVKKYTVTFLKAGEVCEVENVELAPEIFKVLS